MSTKNFGKRLSEIEDFPKDVVKFLINNHSIATAEALIATDSVAEGDSWLIGQLNISSEKYSELIALAKSVLTEEEIRLFTEPVDTSQFPTGLSWSEEDLKRMKENG